jgi:UDP-3-O-[3-hydroxymyristoyl] N-acetylglucosamine deacetylase / 3-hydroxyacyl-[acyl-carrier-protein] dehydratase
MSRPLQRTIAQAVSLEGVGVHSGETASITLHPADAGTGVRFRRVDLEGSPEVPGTVEHVVATELGTTLAAGDTKVLTVEHVMAALSGSEIDNVVVEVTGPEVPIRDGSFQDYLSMLEDAGVVEQSEEAEIFELSGVVQVDAEGGSSYVATPADHLRISATIDFEHPAIGRRFGSFVIDGPSFREQIAKARTFGFKAEADDLHARGLALGASLENAVVLDDEGVMNEGLRFDDEFLRHKVGDIVGDLALLGGRLKANIVAERPSHGGNVALARAIRSHIRRSGPPVADTARIMEFLPHRYPMLLVDRIVEFVSGERIVGIKNVTINEPFFQGHFPGHPIMPGVLILEAMAQCGGLLLMDQVDDPESKVVYFMTMDNVKFRRPVTPGDTLVFELHVVQLRRKVCRIAGRGVVDGHVVAEAEFMARIMDK